MAKRCRETYRLERIGMAHQFVQQCGDAGPLLCNDKTVEILQQVAEAGKQRQTG